MVWIERLSVFHRYVISLIRVSPTLNKKTKKTELRHSCEQNDNFAGYTWTEHDLREGGVQILRDQKNNVEITTEFLKVAGGENGGSWAARIKGRPMNPGMLAAIISSY